VYRRGRQIGTQGVARGPQAHHIARYDPRPAVEGLLDRARAEGADPDGSCVVLGDLDLPDGIFLSVPRGAVPVVVAQLRTGRAAIGLQIGLAAAMPVVRQVRPELFDGLMAETRVELFLRGIAPWRGGIAKPEH